MYNEAIVKIDKNELSKYPDQWSNLIRPLPEHFQIINTYHLLAIEGGMELSRLLMEFIHMAQSLGYEVESEICRIRENVIYDFKRKFTKKSNFSKMDNKACQLTDQNRKLLIGRTK